MAATSCATMERMSALATLLPMSARGTEQTSMPTMSMSAYGGKADIPNPLSNVR
jgi:hypothetical protein